MANKDKFVYKYMVVVTGVCLLLIGCIMGMKNEYEKAIAIQDETNMQLLDEKNAVEQRVEQLLHDNEVLTQKLNETIESNK